MRLSIPAFLVLLSACDGKDADGDDTSGFDDAAIAADLWEAIEGFSDWNEPAGWEGIQPSADGSHGPYVQIWGDDATLAAIDGGTEIPDGGLLVKCGYTDPDGTLVGGEGHALTVMQKIDGYDPEHGDWFWARLKIGTGEVDGFAGREGACYGCHTDADGDFVRYEDLEAPAGE
jgi:hypothetical protein